MINEILRYITSNCVFAVGIWEVFKVVFPSIVSIITFLLGFYISNRIYIKREVKELKENAELFKHYLRSQSKSIKRQASELQKCHSTLKGLNNFEILSYTKITQQYFLLDSLDKAKIIQAGKQIELEPKDTINLLTTIEFSKNVFADFHSSLNSFGKRIEEIQLEWNRHISALHKFISDLYSSMPKHLLENNSDIINLNKMYNSWIESDCDNKSTIDNFIKPVRNHFSSIFNDSPNHPFASQLINLTTSIEISWQKWLTVQASFDNHFGVCLSTFNNNKNLKKLYSYFPEEKNSQ